MKAIGKNKYDMLYPPVTPLFRLRNVKKEIREDMIECNLQGDDYFM